MDRRGRGTRGRQVVRRDDDDARVTLAAVVVVVELLARLGEALTQLCQALRQLADVCS